jgi:hypothetical protein
VSVPVSNTSPAKVPENGVTCACTIRRGLTVAGWGKAPRALHPLQAEASTEHEQARSKPYGAPEEATWTCWEGHRLLIELQEGETTLVAAPSNNTVMRRLSCEAAWAVCGWLGSRASFSPASRCLVILMSLCDHRCDVGQQLLEFLHPEGRHTWRPSGPSQRYGETG